MSYTEVVTRLAWEDLPDAVQAQSKRCLKDIVATAAGSRLLPQSAHAEAIVAEQFGTGAVPMWFTGTASSPLGAAFYNALAIDSLDCHDGFRPNKGHAGATVVPVAAGACAGRAVSGKQLLTAVTMGYELACRAGLAIHALSAPTVHSSGAWAALGAAASGALIQGISPEGLDRVLGMAEYYAPVSPILRCTTHPSIVKDGAAAGAWAAAMALVMAGRDLPGLPSVFEAEPEGREQGASIGEDWMVLRQYFKPYPTCRWTQPVVEGVLSLQREHGFDWQEIERIEVATFREGAELTKFPPEHPDGAQYCTPWAVAAMLVDQELGVRQIHPDRLSDPDILDLGRRVSTRVADDLQERFPAECLARATLTMRDGRTLQGSTTGARGDYTDPLSEAEMEQKFRGLATDSLGEAKSQEIEAVLDSLEERPADDLLALL